MGFRNLIKKLIPTALFQRIEPLGHGAEAILAQVRYGFPARKLKVIGVTGTDGKTSTAMLIATMLKVNGYKTGLITTIGIDYADDKGLQPSPTHMTTASAATLARLIKRVRDNGAEWLVLETSSHALAQHRVWGIPYTVAVMTNVTHEHLDYHKTFERYVAAKVSLFKLCNANKQGLRVGVINAEDPSAAQFTAAIANPVTYGVKSGELRARNIKLHASGSRYEVATGDTEYRIACHLPGQFNVYNSLAAVAVGRALGLGKQQIEGGIAALRSVEGRMYRIESGKGFDIIIDYAVTPGALENVLHTARQMYQGKVAIVFGATGDRDKGKRPVMGEIAAKYADQIYLTDDETYTEDPAAIRAQVKQGIDSHGGSDKTHTFNDRRQAIASALQAASEGDVVLITGLGHQHDRNMGGQLEPWNDAQVVREILQQP